MAARDATATRTRIIDAAEATFAERGIDGARVDEIAARAGVNKRMLYHHYGSKEGLYEAVLRRRLAGRLEAAPLPADTAERLVEGRARAAADPTYLRLLMWEALGAGPAGEVVAEAERTAAARQLRDRTARPALEGADPDHLALLEFALTAVAAAFPQTARMLTGRPVGDPEFQRAHAATLAAVGRALDAAADGLA